MIGIPRLEPVSRCSIIIRSCSISNGLYLPKLVPKFRNICIWDWIENKYLDSLVDGVLYLVEDGAPGAEGGPERVFHLERD
jgi:hypothetical protein